MVDHEFSHLFPPSGSVLSIFLLRSVRRHRLVGHSESGTGTALYAPAVGFVESVNRHTLANHDARAELTCVESGVSGRVHRLDQCMRNIRAKLFDYRALTLKAEVQTDLAGIFAIIASHVDLTSESRRISSKTGKGESQPLDSADSAHWPGRKTLRNKAGLITWPAFNRCCGSKAIGRPEGAGRQQGSWNCGEIPQFLASGFLRGTKLALPAAHCGCSGTKMVLQQRVQERRTGVRLEVSRVYRSPLRAA